VGAAVAVATGSGVGVESGEDDVGALAVGLVVGVGVEVALSCPAQERAMTATRAIPAKKRKRGGLLDINMATLRANVGMEAGGVCRGEYSAT
jgi:hypothetical protein